MRNLKCRIREGDCKEGYLNGNISVGHAWAEIYYQGEWRNVDCINLQRTINNMSHLNTINPFIEKNKYIPIDRIISSNEEKRELSIEEIEKSFNRVRKELMNGLLVDDGFTNPPGGDYR